MISTAWMLTSEIGGSASYLSGRTFPLTRDCSPHQMIVCAAGDQGRCADPRAQTSNQQGGSTFSPIRVRGPRRSMFQMQHKWCCSRKVLRYLGTCTHDNLRASHLPRASLRRGLSLQGVPTSWVDLRSIKAICTSNMIPMTIGHLCITHHPRIPCVPQMPAPDGWIESLPTPV